jgi:DNA mismatch endonuclease, patch repair protein
MSEEKYERPPASTPAVRERMRKQARKDTDCEMEVRRILWKRGFRYRVDVRPEQDLRRKADLVFRRERVVVFIDGCFWHLCPDHGVIPKFNSAWWAAKLELNRERDRQTTEFLRNRGWIVLRFWEHQSASTVAREIEIRLADLRRTYGDQARP